jgi:epoxyqueuosine reductase
MVKQRGIELGFDLIGIAPAQQPLTYRYYEQWLSRKFHGEMGYMERRKEERKDVRNLLPDAKAVIVGAINYFVPDECLPETSEPRGRVARYAWGMDYHEVLLRKLEALLDYLRALLGDWVKGKAYVDTGPILERDFACASGIGLVWEKHLPHQPKTWFVSALGRTPRQCPAGFRSALQPLSLWQVHSLHRGLPDWCLGGAIST